MARMSPPRFEPACLTSLPTELLENIILLATQPIHYGASSITALAQTCALLRSLIYSTPDSHLWRETFLAVFDDPRDLETTLGFSESQLYDWEGLYKARVGRHPDADSVLSATRQAPALPPLDHIMVSGVVPLPKIRRDDRCFNSSWIDDTLNSSSFQEDYESSDQLQWLYGPRRPDAGSVFRRVGKVIVYDMRFLTPDRCWGPFLPIRSDDEESAPPTMQGTDALEIYGVTLDRADFDDPDYVDSERDSDEGEEDEETTRPNTALYPLLLLNHVPAENTSKTPPSIFPPCPHLILPDYRWLAAARLLIEENMKERAFVVFPEPEEEQAFLEEVKALRNLEVLRMGGSPGYWEGATCWKDLFQKKPQAAISGKGKEKETEIEGWDWAGVSGEYRRIVCWMDYRQLLLHNLQGPQATSPKAEQYNRETIRVFPMKLEVSSYSPPPEPPADFDSLTQQEKLPYLLPVINVRGHSMGSDVDEGARRHIWGTVRMIGDGAVRWSLVSAEPDTEDPEWITESVQMGAPGSAMGCMGLWTGAEHEKTDPIGPCWAWKINPSREGKDC